MGFPGGSSSKDAASRLEFNTWVRRDLPAGGNGQPTQYSAWENFMDRRMGRPDPPESQT